MKSRWNNYGLWSALFALILLVCEGYGITNLLPSNYSEITACILTILICAGIINDPTTETKWFLDDSDKKE